ncbi:MAG: hypothetical protein K2M52_02540 [Paramuribaculum sp.]|nr:hypothetical protein [Paramuribaculum sp.]
MRFKVPVIIFIASLVMGLYSCNSGGEEDVIITDLSASNVEIKSFSMVSEFGSVSDSEKEDSLSFSVDLTAGTIFNADSLPIGTVLRKGRISMELPTVSKAEIVMHYDRSDKQDVVVDYLTSPSDSVDFAADKLTISIVSSNQTVRREYTVKINIHQTQPDSLYWDRTPYATIPGSSSSLVASRTVLLNGKYYTVTELSGSATMASGDNLADLEDWQCESITLPSGAIVTSFAATESAMFMIDSDDKLFTSTDGKTWSDTGESMCHIYGGYGETLLGVKNDGGKYFHVTYPASTETEVTDGCPVSGTSALIIYETMWSDKAMAAFTGGKDASGNLSGSTWGYDGTSWTSLSIDKIPAAEGVSVCQYYTVLTDRFSTFTTPMLYAFGGKNASGSISNKVYVSIDRGVHWTEGAANIQPNEFLPLMSGAQAIVCDRTMYVPSDAVTVSRAIKPITSWECPYIYLMGGEFSTGKFNANIYRGVINFLAFIPIQ